MVLPANLEVEIRRLATEKRAVLVSTEILAVLLSEVDELGTKNAALITENTLLRAAVDRLPVVPVNQDLLKNLTFESSTVRPKIGMVEKTYERIAASLRRVEVETKRAQVELSRLLPPLSDSKFSLYDPTAAPGTYNHQSGDCAKHGDNVPFYKAYKVEEPLRCCECDCPEYLMKYFKQGSAELKP